MWTFKEKGEVKIATGEKSVERNVEKNARNNVKGNVEKCVRKNVIQIIRKGNGVTPI